ncbi:MAG: nucleotidyltransferase domain-containing protein [Ignavibacteriae bacterium]|nr:nucleotidyltransferase domain-containing protein [Ignavibacteriota bacterium]
MIEKEKINDIVNIIAMNCNPDKIILFGSYARNNPTEDSDIDLLIIKNTNTPKHKRGREIRKYLYGAMVPMDLKVYTPEEFQNELNDKYSFLFSVAKDFQILYDRKN